LLAAALVPSPGAVAATADGGTITPVGGILWNGCHAYPYSYAVDPTAATWYLETKLFGPDGQALASGLVISDSDPIVGTSTFGLCSRTTERGTFRIEGRLTSTAGSTQTSQELPAATFTLVMPGSVSVLAVDDRAPRRGERVVFTLLSTRQAPEGVVPNDLASVVLQRRTAAGWRSVGGGIAETNARGVARVRVTWQGGRERYRMLTRGDPDEYAGSRSDALTVR
jgi:hypothetical protein